MSIEKLKGIVGKIDELKTHMNDWITSYAKEEMLEGSSTKAREAEVGSEDYEDVSPGLEKAKDELESGDEESKKKKLKLKGGMF